MNLPEGYRPRTPCADGGHVWLEHDHSWWAALAPERRATKVCSERFVCVKCRNWYDGEPCQLAKTAAA